MNSHKQDGFSQTFFILQNIFN